MPKCKAPLDEETEMKDAPNFAAWSLENLTNFATESYQRMIEQDEALEQLRLDLRDAMKMVRDTVLNEVPQGAEAGHGLPVEGIPVL